MRQTSQRLAAIAASVAIGGSFLAAVVTSGFAQDDGTGAAPIPPPTECVLVPALAPVVTVAGPAASPVASPEGSPAALPDATPVVSTGTDAVSSPVASPVVDGPLASPASSPVASPVVEVTTASDGDAGEHAPLLAELQDTANSIFACLNERNFQMYAAFTSDAFRGRLFGSTDPLPAAQFVPLAATLPDVDSRILTFDNLQVVDESTVMVDITYLTANQAMGGTWTFVKARVDGLLSWTLDREEPQPVAPPAGAGRIGLTFEDAAFDLDPTSVSGPDIVFALDNPTGEDHEALVLRLDEGVDTSVLLQGGAGFPEGVTYVGQVTVLAGAEGTLVLLGLEPGTYTIVDLLPDTNGLPHLSLGMEATFTVS